MSTDRWGRIQELYHASLDLEPSARSEFLSQACPHDPELRSEVESLLAHEGKADGLLESPAWKTVGAVEPAALDLAPGSQVGVFCIVGLLGAGGMGKVYRATDARLNRDVAIKMLPAEYARQPQWLSRLQREARALASLSHPHICALHDVGPNYLVMECIEGETLSARIKKGALPLDRALRIAIEIAGALGVAHSKGIIHRDLKPGNIMLTGAGAKLLDFGLARYHPPAASGEEAISTAPTGETQVLGTLRYMSPEQLLGKEADVRSDIFAFGAVLYEMLTGHRAFHRQFTIGTIFAVGREEPKPLHEFVRGMPAGLERIILRCVRKDPEERYSSMLEIERALEDCRARASEPASGINFRVLFRQSKRPMVALPLILILLVLGGLGAWWLVHSYRARWARNQALPEIGRLVDAGEFVKAAALTREALAALPKDPTLETLWKRTTGEVTITSIPSGAEVSIRPYRGDPNAWETLGKTPLQKVRVPLDAYVWRVIKPSFVAEFMIGQPAGAPPPGFHNGFDWKVKLRPEASVPPEMVVVSGARVGLGYPLAYAPSAQVDDFLIDRHEVTNEEYKRFVDAGGYRKRGFWKQPFMKGGRAIAWEDGVALFQDQTGRPGPATWEIGEFPKGREKYPVAGVSWYEAAAYAEFAGKSLPTAYHWTLASQSAGFTPLITAGSNFRREGLQAVGSPDALSGFGTTDMAGNVKEWCWNEAQDAKRLILGGGFGEPNYMFRNTDAQSPWDRRANFGFRCAKLDLPPASAAQNLIEVKTRDYSREKPVPDAVFNAYAALYAYDKAELNPQVEEIASMEGWSRSKVTFDAAYGHERVTAYFFLPRNAPPPFQAVVHFPGGYAFMDDKLDLAGAEDAYGFLIKSGRALIFLIYKGMYERRDGFRPDDNPPGLRRDHQIMWSKDLGRLLDYLETRKDIDSTKVAYLGASAGGAEGAHLPAVEKRIKAAILLSGGFQLTIRYLPEGDPFNFVRHVTIPVLMLNGRYDNSFPLESSQDPLFQLLGTPGNDKKHVIYEGGHGAFPRPDAVRESLDWLDKYLGPVRR